MAFRHVDHVELCWRLLSELPADAAFARLESELMAIATRSGVPQRYDHAMTRAYFQLVVERRALAPEGETLESFLARNGDLLSDGAALVKAVLALS